MRLAKEQLDVGIVPSDPDATLAFYRDLIGLEQLPSANLGQGTVQHRFKTGRHMIKLNQRSEPPPRQRGGTERAIGMRLLALIVDDLDAIVARLDAAGRKHSSVPTGDAPYRVAFTKDPEGNVIELVGLKRPGGPELKTRLQIGLTVADVERSRHFYGQVLGLEEEPVMKLGAMGTRYGFVWGKTTVKFWAAPSQVPVQTGAPHAHAGLRLFTVMVEDLDEAHRELVAKDVPVRVEPYELPGIARIMFVADPDDNWIELAQRLR